MGLRYQNAFLFETTVANIKVYNDLLTRFAEVMESRTTAPVARGGEWQVRHHRNLNRVARELVAVGVLEEGESVDGLVEQ